MTEKDPQAAARERFEQLTPRERRAVIDSLYALLLSLSSYKTNRPSLAVTPLEDRPLLDRFSWN